MSKSTSEQTVDSESRDVYRHQWRSFLTLVRTSKTPWYLFFLSFLCDAASATLFVQLPKIIGKIMQGAIFNSGLTVQYGLLSLGQVLLGFVGATIFNWIFMKVNVASSVGVWNKIIQVPLKAIMREHPSTLTSRVTDDSAGVGTALSGIFNAASEIYTVVITYVTMFQMNVGITLVLLTIPLIVAISCAAIDRLSYRTAKYIQDTLSAFTSFLSVRLPNMRMVKAFGMQDDERELGYQRVQEQYRAQLKNVELDAISSVFQNLADTASNAIILVYGGYLVATGGLQLASLIAFFSYVSQGSFVNSAENIVLYYQNIKMGLGACATIMEVAKTPDERVKTGKSFTVPEADITFDDVTFGYDPEDPVLRDVSFTIPSGKTTAIVGSNSSGKTTVLRLLERFYGPDKGTISYGGEKIDDFDLDEWRDSMGYVVQNSPLVKGTVELNICYGMEKPDHDLAVQAAKEADAYDFVMGMDNGFDSQIGELGGGISGGQRQKLGIARAIVRHPEMMLLDEATTGLDATSIVEIDKTLEHTLRGKTVVKVAHRLDEIEDSDQVVFLDHGRVRGVGPHDELLRDNEDYRRFCGFAS